MTYKMLRTELWFGRLLRTKQCFPNNHVPVLAVQQKDVKCQSGGCLEWSGDRKLTVAKPS